MTELDSLEKKLSLGWQALSAPDDLQARVRARLASVSGGAPVPAPTRRLSYRWRALRASGVLGASTGALLLGIGIAVGYLIPRTPLFDAPDSAATSPLVASARRSSIAPASPASPPSAAPTATSAGESGAAADSNASAAVSPPAARMSAPIARSHRPSSTPAHPSRPTPESELFAPNDHGAELLLLERAERAVRSKTPALALALTRELDQRYPRSPLQEERRSIELMAHCQEDAAGAATTSTETAELTARFLRRYPASVYGARISRECDASSMGTDKDEGPGH